MGKYLEIISSSFEQGYALPPVYERICVTCGNRMECLFDDMDEIVGRSCNNCGGTESKQGAMIIPAVKS